MVLQPKVLSIEQAGLLNIVFFSNNNPFKNFLTFFFEKFLNFVWYFNNKFIEFNGSFI